MTSPVYKIEHLAFLLLHVVCLTSSFLIDSHCLAPSPCTCSPNYIRCDSKQLAAVPAFKTSTTETSSLTVYLSSNHITSIPANAFLNISTVNATSITFYLYSNQINSISSTAFKGVENSTTTLNLLRNNLTTIPSIIGKLVSLKRLLIQDNPIHTINPTVFAIIGHSLTYLGISLDQFITWPDELHFLRNLQTLTLQKIPFSSIDEHAFRGFETTLTSLTISSSKLLKIPSANCHLTHLNTFRFFANTELIEPIVQSCKMPLVTSLDLQSNQLTEFPQLLSQYPSLASLYLNINQIHLVKAEDIPFASHLTKLYMYNNMLSMIPNAINHLKALSILYISGNKIESVEDNDLAGLKSLTHLYLQDNPLSYISPHAFKRTISLNYLNLDTTQLGHIPSAVMSLPKLTTFLISGKAIECTCDMAYLKPWNVSSISVTSKCESSTETIKDFILHSLPQCP